MGESQKSSHTHCSSPKKTPASVQRHKGRSEWYKEECEEEEVKETQMTMAKMQGRTVISGEKERWRRMGCERGVRKRRRDEMHQQAGEEKRGLTKERQKMRKEEARLERMREKRHHRAKLDRSDRWRNTQVTTRSITMKATGRSNEGANVKKKWEEIWIICGKRKCGWRRRGVKQQETKDKAVKEET